MNTLRKLMSRFARPGVISISVFLTLLSFSNVRAQVNPVYKRMVQNGWSYPFRNGFRKLTPPEIDSQFCKSMGYNDSSVSNLHKVGVEVVGRWKGHVEWNKKAWAALSDCIVIGTVTKIEHPFPRHFWFHTVAYVQVDDFLRNDYGLPKGQLAILEVSGPTGKPGERVNLLGEKTLNVGQHDLLFLSASSLILFAADNNMHDLYKYLINDSTIKFQLLAKYNVESNEIISKGRKQTLNSLMDSIQSVLDAIHRSVPTTR